MDVGSSAIRYLVAEFTGPAHFFEVESQRVPVRLGHGTFRTGVLAQRGMDEVVEALIHFRHRFDDLGIDYSRAVATSAVRESRNGGEFIDRVHRESGIRLEIITGSEEARLVWVAVRNRIPLDDRPWVLLDLGGGSVEVSLVDEAGILWSESHRMGSVRLLEEFSADAAAPDRFRELVESYVAVLKIPISAEEPPAGVIATGGNIEALARLAGREPDENGVSVLPLADLRTLAGELAGLSREQRIRQLGLREDRADVIMPAAVVYERLAAMTGVDRILVPHVGVRDGILLDVAGNLFAHPGRSASQGS